MRLISIELYMYKPFLHHKTTHFKCTDISHVTVVSGENACGKSSLLRAMSPFPPVSTEFEKDGYKIAMYEHNGCYYELSSDFRKPNGAHSFKRDGVELNESGTTDVQYNLVKEHLEYDDIIDKIVTGKFRICDSGKPERKTLFMSTYPSSLGFVLNYHKNITSALRAIKQNINKLESENISKQQKLIPSDILEDYKREKADLEKGITSFDLDIYTVNKAINSATDNLNKLDTELQRYTSSYFFNKIKKINNRFIELVKKSKSTEMFKDYAIIMDRINIQKKAIQQSIKEYDSSARNLKEDIDKYNQCLSADAEEMIKEYTKKLQIQNSIIENTKIDEYLPSINDYEFNKLKENYDKIAQALSRDINKNIYPYWSETTFKEQEQKLNNLKSHKQNVLADIERYRRIANDLNAKMCMYTKHSWPEDCLRCCNLRQYVGDARDAIKAEYNNVLETIQDLEREAKGVENKIIEQTAMIAERAPFRKIIDELSKFFDTSSWADQLLRGMTFIGMMNKREGGRTFIYNNITHLLENAERERTVNEAKNMKQVLETKIENLRLNDAPARQLVRETILKQEVQLNKYIRELNEAKSKLLDLNEKEMYLNSYADIIKELEALQSLYTAWRESSILRNDIKFWRKWVDNVASTKLKVQNRITELAKIIKEQEELLIVLNQSTLPKLKILEREKTEYTAIEEQLSPSKGIAHRYIVRYINAVFSLANEFISRVWSYPMQLEYIDEDDESFDYKFRLIINETSFISDINIASSGQKAIINLCVMLAICIFREYGKTYPVILDEVTVNMSLNHQNNLIQFLNELFSQNDLSQIFIVDHCIDVCSSFASIAEMICLSRDFEVGQEWKKIGTIE